MISQRQQADEAEAADPEVAFAFLGRLAECTLDRQQAAGEGVPFTLGATQEPVAEDLGTVREVLVRSSSSTRRG